MTRVSNVILHVGDVDESVAFYEGLGLSVVGRSEAMVFLDTGSVSLALASGRGSIDPGDTEIVLEFEDVDQAYARLSDEIEFRVAPRPVTTPGDRTLYAADFRDPDGHVLSITGWK
ncbi:MAG: VOC family protein [Acidimicrobiia bacterium]